MSRKILAIALTFATLASAEEPAADPLAVSNLVQKVLIQPLISKENVRSRFSRAMLPAPRRRVRVVDESAQRDAEGQVFYRFAVDTNPGFVGGDDWDENQMTGCAYPASGKVFVLRSDTHFPSALMLGKRVPAAEKHICHASPGEVAEAR